MERSNTDTSTPLIGHAEAYKALKQTIRSNQASHAILLKGVAHLGKTRLALEMALLILCKESGDSPCGKCNSCQNWQRGKLPDLHIISTEDSIKIEQIRELRQQAALKPLAAESQVWIITDAEKMTIEAQNALLKTLEEPKGESHIFLTSTAPHKLQKTILSRVLTVSLNPVSNDLISKYLDKQTDLSSKDKEEILSLSQGRPGLAINFSVNKKLAESVRVNIEKFWKLKEDNLADRFNEAAKLAKQEEGVDQLLEDWIIYLRQDLVKQSEKELVSSEITRMMKKITDTQRFITANVATKTALENLFITL